MALQAFQAFLAEAVAAPGSFTTSRNQAALRFVPSRSQGQWWIIISFLLIELFHQKVLVAGMRGLLQDLEGTCLSCLKLEVSRA